MNKEIRTDLDAFEYVVEKLLEQNQKSMDMDETCQYRGYKLETIKNAYDEMSKDYPYGLDELSLDFAEFLTSIPSDAKCAVGHLISDNVYYNSIEGEGLNYEVYEMVKLSNPNWLTGDLNLDDDSSWRMLQHLQKIHDRESVAEWAFSFIEMRGSFNEDGTYNFKD